MKLLISAAEASADLHAAQLIRALKRQVSSLDFFGIGGSCLTSEGLVPLARAEDLAVMGSVEILSRLPKIRKAERDLLKSAQLERPDVAVLIDYPGFHFRVGPRLRSMGIPVIYYIPPKVWVWRKNRVEFMKSWVSQVLCVLPFEPAIYNQAGIPAEYIGSPLIEELPLSLSRSEARAQLGLDSDSAVLALLPGSRSSEMKSHFDEFLQAAKEFAHSTKRLWTVMIPVASTLHFPEWEDRLKDWFRRSPDSKSMMRVRLVRESSGMVLRAAEIGLVKSGTATLEAAVLDCPMVVAYRPSSVTSFAVKHFIRYSGPVGLVNLFRGWRKGDRLIAPEVLHKEMTATRLADELKNLYLNPERMEKMRADFEDLRVLMQPNSDLPESPSDRAVRIMLRSVSEFKLRNRT